MQTDLNNNLFTKGYLLADQISSPNITTILPPGKSTNSYTVYVMVLVTDNLGSFGTANVSINVTGYAGSANLSSLLAPLTNYLTNVNNSATTSALQKMTLLRLALIHLAVFRDSSCPTCSNHGSCPSLTGFCVCNSGFYLADCSCNPFPLILSHAPGLLHCLFAERLLHAQIARLQPPHQPPKPDVQRLLDYSPRDARLADPRDYAIRNRGRNRQLEQRGVIKRK